MGEIRKHKKYRYSRPSKDGTLSCIIKNLSLAKAAREYCERNNILVANFMEEALAEHLAKKISEERNERINGFINNISSECTQETLSKIISLLSGDKKADANISI